MDTQTDYPQGVVEDYVDTLTIHSLDELFQAISPFYQGLDLDNDSNIYSPFIHFEYYYGLEYQRLPETN